MCSEEQKTEKQEENEKEKEKEGEERANNWRRKLDIFQKNNY